MFRRPLDQGRPQADIQQTQIADNKENEDGKLIKRPLVVGDGVTLVGFKEDEWKRALA